MSRPNTPKEDETEDQLFFVLFKEMIREEGWNWFYVQSNFDNILYFGKDSTMDELKATGCIVRSSDYLFKMACKCLIKEKESFKPTK